MCISLPDDRPQLDRLSMRANLGEEYGDADALNGLIRVIPCIVLSHGRFLDDIQITEMVSERLELSCFNEDASLGKQFPDFQRKAA